MHITAAQRISQDTYSASELDRIYKNLEPKNILKQKKNLKALNKFSRSYSWGHPNSCVRMYGEPDLRARPEVSELAASKTPTSAPVYPTCRTATARPHPVHDTQRARATPRRHTRVPNLPCNLWRNTDKISSHPTTHPNLGLEILPRFLMTTFLFLNCAIFYHVFSNMFFKTGTLTYSVPPPLWNWRAPGNCITAKAMAPYP